MILTKRQAALVIAELLAIAERLGYALSAGEASAALSGLSQRVQRSCVDVYPINSLADLVQDKDVADWLVRQPQALADLFEVELAELVE